MGIVEFDKYNEFRELSGRFPAVESVHAAKAPIEHAEPPSYSLMIAQFPGNNQTHPDSAGWVTETAIKASKDPRIKRVVPWRKSDTPITMVRNDCVRTALELGIDYLLMIDSDMSPDIIVGDTKITVGDTKFFLAPKFWDSSWGWMMKRRWSEGLAGESNSLRPATIAAPYCGPPPNECVYVFKWKTRQSDTPNKDYRLEMFEREDAAIRAGVEEVAALPTGLILYDMRVFKELAPPWFRYEYSDEYETRKATTEDVYQTRNASLLGMPQYVNWDCWAGHVKLKTVGKPCILTADAVSETLREALRRGHREKQEVRVIESRGVNCKNQS